MITACYEKGHTPGPREMFCMRCGLNISYAIVNGERVWHTQAELDRLWKGVDRMAQVLFFGTLVAVIVAVWIRVIFG